MGSRQLAEAYRADGYAAVLKGPFAGLFEMAQRIVGMENLLMMMARVKRCHCSFRKLADLKLGFREMVCRNWQMWLM